jgi:hypothetical protein
MREKASIVLTLAIGLWAVGCGKTGDGGANANGGPAGGSGEQPAAGTGILTEAEVETYLQVWPEYVRRVQGAARSGSAARMALWPQEFLAFLKSKGLTPEEFGVILAKVTRAWGAAQIREGFEASGQPMPEIVMAPFKDVPEDNIRLVSKYKTQLEAMYEKAGAEE